MRFPANLRVRLIGMEACGSPHFLGGRLREQGDEVRLRPLNLLTKWPNGSLKYARETICF